MTGVTTRIGENWVKNPNRALPAIELEFDETADEYEERSAEWDYRGAVDGAEFFAGLVARTAKVIDAGCGTGLVGRELARRGFIHLAACDISAGMLAHAHAKGVYPLGLFKSDIGAMPFGHASFDALLCVAVLTYAASIERVFAEFERVVRPGGLIVFSHRVDLERDCGFDAALALRLDGDLWQTVRVSPPRLYYPRKEDYADKITVRYHAYRTLA